MSMKTIIPLNIESIEKGNYHLFVKIKIGRRVANMLLDTGASKTVFDQEKILKYIEASAIQSQHVQSVGLGSSDNHTDIAKIPHVRFYDLKLSNFEVAVLDLSN